MQRNVRIAARPLEGQRRSTESAERSGADLASASCPWCGERRADPEWPDRGSAEFRLERCAACGLVYTMPQLAAEQIADYYPQTYYGDCNARFHPLFESLIDRLLRDCSAERSATSALRSRSRQKNEPQMDMDEHR